VAGIAGPSANVCSAVGVVPETVTRPVPSPQSMTRLVTVSGPGSLIGWVMFSVKVVVPSPTTDGVPDKVTFGATVVTETVTGASGALVKGPSSSTASTVMTAEPLTLLVPVPAS